MSTRQLPRWSQLRESIRFRPLTLDPVARRLERALTVTDLREVARRTSPRSVFDYTDGAAGTESTLHRARDTFASLELRPSVLRDVSELDTSTTVLGGPAALPLVFGPTGFTRLMHHEGELAVARVAERQGVPYCLATLGTTSIERVADAVPSGRRWFQLYVWRDRSRAEELMRRAEASGYEALVLTVDVPVVGARHRDVRNGFTIPPTLTGRTMLNAARHPGWWVNLLTTEPLTFASLSSWDTDAQAIDELLDPSMTIDDLEWIRAHWHGPLVVKGIQTVEDARRVVAAGADAIVVSSHGGRQLDQAPVPLRLLPDVRDALGGGTEVLLDTGVMSGTDVVAALALGADAVLVGRAYLYGLMAGGQRGVERMMTILTAETRRTMALLGVRTVAELGPQHVRLAPER
ncbi:alpha-hydroxy acid oxidase [Nocardioides sp.]|uniref:alpha-hydroxy acid oxidase n=1 Tax=Nocardioides sp. TaxID=35761 RepID=UPI0025E89E17|nr:alpha-hydroxy acid oxidase [Nocardioides sp.]